MCKYYYLVTVYVLRGCGVLRRVSACFRRVLRSTPESWRDLSDTSDHRSHSSPRRVRATRSYFSRRRAIYTFVGSSGANGERKAALRGRERVSVVEDVDFANIHLELKDGRCAMVELSEAEVGSFDDLLEQLSEEFESSFAGKVTSPPLHDIRRDSHETMSGRCRFVPSRWIQHRSR